MDINNKIKFAVVGVGNIGKRHIDVISKNANCELVAICDIKELNDNTLDKYQYFNSIDTLLTSNIDIDVINICTPNGLHYEQSKKALLTNHHVICEKPMVLKSKEASELIAISRKTKKNIACVMQNRFSPSSIWLKQMIDNNLLGNIFMIQVNCFWNRDNRYYTNDNWRGTNDMDGGSLFTQFSHFIDMIYWVFGDISNFKGIFKDFNHKNLTEFEDSGIVTFDIKKGGIGTLSYSTSVYDKNLESSITVIGENGSLKITGQYMNEVAYCNIKNYSMPKLAKTNPPNEYGSYSGSAANHEFVIENMVKTLQNKEFSTQSAMEGKKVVEIIENIYKVRNRSFRK